MKKSGWICVKDDTFTLSWIHNTFICKSALKWECFLGGTSGKNTWANSGSIRDVGSIPGSGRSHGGGLTTCSSILAWENPWTEEPGELRSIESRRIGHDWATEHTSMDMRTTDSSSYHFDNCFTLIIITCQEF